MGDVFAIVSKAVFEKEARIDGEVVGLGDVWPVSRYTGTGKVFESALADGGRIFMVTVRPPDEKLWLLAILESPTFDKKSKAWVAAPNVVGAVDITALRKTIKFESGKGMSQDKGTLGMSLQTPRALGPGDAEKILALCGGSKASKAAASSSAKATSPGAAKDKEKDKKASFKMTTRSSDRVAALLSAIRDEPDDAANRHVLADQYEAGGDPDRANFIRSQIARAEMPRWDPRAVAMELDERGFRREHEARWRAELPTLEGVRYTAFDRGLFGWVAFDDAELVSKHSEAIMAASTITGMIMRWPRRGARPKLGAIAGLRKLIVTGTLLQNSDLDWLAKNPILSTVQELTLDHSNLDDDALKALLKSPHLGKLRRLRLPFHQLGNKGIKHLAAASLPQLVELGLRVEVMDNIGSGGRDGDGINGDGVLELCAWDQMAKLECLDLTGNQIGETGLTTILASKNTKRITTLRIRSISDFDVENDYERPDVLCAFEHLKGDRHYEELDIGENELSSDAVKGLANSPALEKLRILSFDFSQADNQVVKLLDAKWLDAVHMLSLNETTLPVVKKVMSREPKSLHTVSFRSSFPRSDLKGVGPALAGASEQKALQSIDLLGCNIDDAALKKLGTVTTMPALIEIRIGANPGTGYSSRKNHYSKDAAQAFLESPLGKQLKSVTLRIDELDRLPIPGVTRGGDDDDDDDDDDYDDEDDE